MAVDSFQGWINDGRWCKEAGIPSRTPEIGDFVEVRGRPCLVEGIDDKGEGLFALKLSCISDDAQGESLEVAWDAEIGARRLEDDFWSRLGRDGTDDPAVFAAYLRTLKWHTATAADRELLQAPFRAGIRLEAYQLLPLRKALRLPRVDLLIADDVGLGKTIEAGLILRELLLRRRIDFTVVGAPPSMTLQWQDELEAKFGLAFTIIVASAWRSCAGCAASASIPGPQAPVSSSRTTC